ncbi:MAG: hypothetical protein ACLP0J_31235 [Solirubrobacteraceae bacterium]|jgi:hypothetical protein
MNRSEHSSRQFQVINLIGRFTADPTLSERKETRSKNLRLAVQGTRKDVRTKGADDVVLVAA